MKTCIIEACTDLGLHIDGAKYSPKMITSGENFDSIITVTADNIEKNKDTDNSNKNLKYVNKFNEKLYIKVREVIENGNFPLTIGGDHSIAIGSALAAIKEYDNLGIIWVDSHGDFNCPETSPTGNIHGYPFAAVCGFHNEQIVGFHDGNFYNPKNAVLVGARDIDFPYEVENLKKAGVTIFTTDDIIQYGVEEIMKRAFKIASKNTNGIHVSYDVDAIDPNDAPGVSIRVANGFDKNQAMEIVDYIVNNSELVKSFDLVEFNPNYDIDDKTLKLSKKIVKTVNKINNGHN